GEVTLAETIPDETAEDPDVVVPFLIAQEELGAQVWTMLSCLTERERAVVILRYRLDGQGERRTLQEVGRLLLITRERVRQLEAKALDKLRGAGCPLTITSQDGWDE